MIEGVESRPLRILDGADGALMHMLRSDAPHFRRFGEVYFSQVRPGCIKAWKRHTRMTQNIAVPVGQLRVVVYDTRPDSRSRGVLEEYVLGASEPQYQLLTLPPGIWYGFQCLSEVTALIANCADMPHDPAEQEKAPRDDSRFPTVWT